MHKKSIIKKTADTQEKFATLQEAANSIPGADPKVIMKVLKGKLMTAYGCRWQYASDLEE